MAITAEELAQSFHPRPRNCTLAEDYRLARKDAAKAIELLTETPKGIEPLYYVKGNRIFQRPTKGSKPGARNLGFCVCEVWDGVDPAEVCAILNKGEPATE